MRHATMLIGFIMLCLAGACQTSTRTAAPVPRFAPWINGTAADEPSLQVQRYDENTFVIRQSLRTNAEGPFLYLLFGEERALLLDTGAGGAPVRPTIDALITEWSAAHQRASIPLVIAHSHGHGDHIAGDAEFNGRPDTQIVGTTPMQVAAYFGFTAWPREIRTFELGQRALTIIPTPGHQPAHIAIYDSHTHALLSGDMLYPGRLYIPSNRFADYRDSVERLVAFTREHPVSVILGAHIEMTTNPGQDIALGASAHPNERALELGPEALPQLQAAIAQMGDEVQRHETADFIVFPLPPRAPDPPGFEPSPVN